MLSGMLESPQGILIFVGFSAGALLFGAFGFIALRSAYQLYKEGSYFSGACSFIFGCMWLSVGAIAAFKVALLWLVLAAGAMIAWYFKRR